MMNYDFSLTKLRNNKFPQDDDLAGTVIFAIVSFMFFRVFDKIRMD